MDPYSSNPGAPPPPQTESNQTRYLPPQEGYGAQDASAAGPEGYAPAPPPNAGVPNYQPPYQRPMSPYTFPFARRDRDRTMLALILIAGGILFLLGQFFTFRGFGDFVLLAIGGVFLYAYFNTRPGYRTGFLIPGSILTGIGVGEVLSNFTPVDWVDWVGGNITTVTLGLGFCMIWFFERRHWWALIPGGILVVSGISNAFVVGRLWPLIFIGLGVYMLYGRSRRRV